MGGQDFGQVLLVLPLALGGLAHRGGGGVGEPGGGGGALDAGVHVGLVVVADIHHVVAPLHGPGQGLEADVISAAIPAEGDEFVVVLHLAPAF